MVQSEKEKSTVVQRLW